VSHDVTEELIRRLARDPRPVRRVRTLRADLARVAALAAALTALFLAGRGLRPPGVSLLAGSTPFLWMALGLAIAGLAGATAALAFARPGRAGTGLAAIGVATAALLGATAVASALLSSTLTGDEPLWTGAREIPCVVGSLFFSLPIAYAIGRLAAGAAPMRPVLTAWLAAAGASALGGLVGHLACRTPGAWHIVLTHSAVPLVGSVLLALPLYVLVTRRRAG